MHQGYWGEERVLATVDRFARFGLLLHPTETSLVSRHLMPPEIDDGAWLGAPSGPARADGTPKTLLRATRDTLVTTARLAG